MDMKEKLEVIAHLGDHITYKEGIGICYDSDLAKVIEDAYMTLKNGVTVQKWIPVSERLPGDDSDVLAYLRIGEEGRIYPANYAKGMWFDCIFNTPATETTTHWMPLPQPPKGD